MDAAHTHSTVRDRAEQSAAIKWGRLKVHMPSCVVLVINDNLYGLMFALSYTSGNVHRQCLSHMVASRLKEEEENEEYQVMTKMFKE